MKLPAAMRIKYDQFMDEGSLIVLEGTVLDMMEVYEDLDNHIAEFTMTFVAWGMTRTTQRSSLSDGLLKMARLESKR